MAIRDVVTRGYGNGTYDPGVNDIPTRGYTISQVVAPEDRTTWRPSQAAGPNAYRPDTGIGPAVYRPGSASGPSTYRPDQAW